MEEKRDNVSAQEISSDRNSRRRARYAQMSPETKELFLSQLREKRAELKRQKVLHRSNSAAALTINTSSLSPQQGTKACYNGRDESLKTTKDCYVDFQSFLTPQFGGFTGMEEKRDNVSAQEISSDRNSRRRARYAQMSVETKELFLSQLREKRAESKRQKVLHRSNSAAALTISTSSLSPQRAFQPTNLPVSSITEQCIVHCLSTFEVGSTSTTSHVASKLTSKRTANTGTTYSIKVGLGRMTNDK